MIISGNLTSKEIDEVLESQYLGRIGMNSNGKNYVVPVTYYFDKEKQCIIGVSGDGMKVKMLRENPKVCFEVEDIESLSTWKTVIAWGVYEELQGADARRAIHAFVTNVGEILRKKGEFPARFLKDLSHNTALSDKQIIYRISIGEKTGRYEKS